MLGGALLAPAALGTAEGELRRQARGMLAAAETMARQTDPAVPVERRLVTGAPAPVLIEQASTAEMVVLGDRGLGGFAALPVGSVAAQVATHSPAPVMVVKGNITAEGPVVVCLDGSVGAERAMAWAVREAQARRAPLHAETAETLVRVSEAAQLVVVSPASRHLLHHAHCPTLIVPA